MSTTPEDVAVRISPKGLDEISAAFRTILGDINRTARQGQRSLGVLEKSARSFGNSFRTLGIAAAVVSLTAFVKSAANATDQAGKLAEKVGTTAETLSTLEFAAKTSNVSNEELQTGITRLIQSIGELERGTDKQVKAFQRLGLSARDFTSLDSGQAFARVAEEIGKLGSGAARTRVVLDLFGRQGANLIPLFNELADKGFARVREEAERFGLVVDTETAAAAAAVNDSFSLMGAQVRGLAVQFLSGLAPTVATVMEDFRNDTAGKGVTAMQDFGRETGKFLRNTVSAFKIWGRSIGLQMAIFVRTLKGIKENIAELGVRGGGPTLLARISENDKETAADIAALQQAFDEDMKELEAQRAASEKREQDLTSNALERAKAREKALAELRRLEAEQNAAELFEKQRKDKEKADKEKERIEKAANDALLDINRAIFEAQGKSREAQILALDAEIAKHREALAEAGKLNSETEALIEKLRALSVQKIDFGGIEEQIERELQAFTRAREQIKDDVELNIISEIQGNERLKELEASRVPILKALVEEARKLAVSLGNEEMLAKLSQFDVQIQTIERNLRSATDIALQLGEGAFDAFGEGVENVLKNAEDLHAIEDIFKSIRNTVIDALQDIAAEILATFIKAQVLKGLQGIGLGFSGGGVVRAATGGLLKGPGTGTSDSILARLSNNEYVVRAAAVKRPGVLSLLDYLNRNLRLPRNLPRFRDGGLVGKIQPASSGGPGGFKIVNVLDPGTIRDAMQSPPGEQVILNTIERNPGIVRRIVSLR